MVFNNTQDICDLMRTLRDSGGTLDREIIENAELRAPLNDLWLDGSSWSEDLVNALRHARNTFSSMEDMRLCSESKQMMEKFEEFKETEIQLI